VELMEAIRTRRSCKKFTDQPVPREFIEQVLEAGLWAPSGQNLQPVRFWVVAGSDLLRELEEDVLALGMKLKKLRPLLKLFVAEFRGEKGVRVFRSLRPELFNSCPLLIFTGAERGSSTTRAKDCTLAAMNLMLAAHDLGLATCYFGWTTLVNRLPRWKERLGIPPEVEIIDGIGLGYPTAEREAPPRKAVEEVTTWIQE